MRNKSYLVILSFMLLVCPGLFGQQKDQLEQMLDAWHKAAAEANFEDYFGAMAEESIFVGTDATENWNKNEFMAYSKPYFDRGRAWSFTAIQRNLYLAGSGGMAWFDELLSTQMGICRGSGVLEKIGGEWKIRHYVLSLDVPNENVSDLVALKKERDSLFILSRARKN